MSLNELHRFRRMVLTDPELQTLLMRITDATAFAAEVIRLGKERGYSIEAEEVAEAVQQSRLAWQLRRVR